MGNHAVGDTMCIPKTEHTTRLHFQNVNGVSLGKGGTWEHVVEEWKKMEVDIGAICEHKLDTNFKGVMYGLKEGAERHLGRGTFRLLAGSTPTTHGRQYKPGGTLITTMGPTSGRVMTTHLDEAGRWTSITLRRKQLSPLTIICTYQVVEVDPRSEGLGDSTYAAQLHAYYTSKSTNSKYQQPEKLRKYHASDLLDYVCECQMKGESIILVGDLNEVLGEENGAMTKLLSTCKLVDVVATHHMAANFSTYQRGRKVIDYCLMDEELAAKVTACGYEPFSAHIISDHRGIYIDFNSRVLFGNTIQPLAPMPLRDLNTKRIHQIPPYFKFKDQFLTEADWYNNVRKLEKAMQAELQDDATAEALYQTLIWSCQSAGSKLKPYFQSPYSPDIERMRKIQNLLRIQIKCYTSNIDLSIRLDEAKAKLGSLGYQVPDTLKACKAALAQHNRELKAMIREEEKEGTRRKEHMQKLIAEKKAQSIRGKTGSNKKKATRILQRIKRAEEISKVFGKCQKARGKQITGGLSHVLVPEDDTVDPKTCEAWKLVDAPEEIELLLQERNRKHFGQSDNCNLTSPPFDFSMDFTGDCQRAEALLNAVFTSDPALFPSQRCTHQTRSMTCQRSRSVERFHQKDQQRNRVRRGRSLDSGRLDRAQQVTLRSTSSNGVAEMTKVLFEACRFVNDNVKDQVSFSLTEVEYRGKIMSWKERTSTSPGSNMHLGHLRAYWAQHLLEEGSDEEAELETIRSKILRGHLILLNYALKFGYSYDSWKMIVNSMLEKDPGSPKIHRLRVIHLYEADYNLILAVKWRQLLHYACDNGFVNPSLFGSQPGKEALDACFLRELEYEITRLTRKPIIHFDNDATSCYDRIPVFIANVISRKYGMNRKVCVVHGRTLAEAKYHIKTKLGISDSFLQHCRAHPFMGNGQGAGDSPQKWLFMSSTLFDIYEPRAHGSTFESPDGNLKAEVKLVGFVDDVRNSTNCFSWEGVSMSTLAKYAERDSQLWHDALVAINQSLELPKCGYHAIRYKFLANGEPEIDDTSNVRMTITDSTGKSLPIAQWPNSKPVKYLGNKKSISNQEPQKEELKRKCDEFARVVATSPFQRRDAHVFYYAIYRLSVGYPLPTCHFTEEELHKTQMKAHRAIVAKCGYNRNTSQDVLLAPLHLGGAGFFHLYDEQSYGQFKLFMKFWRSPETIPGKLMRITVAWAQMCAGTQQPILEDTTTPLPHLESKWLKSLRSFLGHIGGSIELKDTFVEPLQREGDRFLMDVAIQAKVFTPKQLKKINYCRMYLNALLVSDVVTACGFKLEKTLYKGNNAQLRTTKHRVHQKRPNEKSWKQWQRLLRLLTPHQHTLKLTTPLGGWLVPVPKMRRKWSHLYDPTSDKLFYQCPYGFTQHSKISIDYDKTPDQTPTHAAIPNTAVPVDIVDRPYTWSVGKQWSQTLCDLHHSAESEQETRTVLELIDSMDNWEVHLLQHLTVNDATEDTIWKALTTMPCVIATDGSAPKGKGSFAWIISDAQGNILAKCHGPTFGHRISSYRSEGYGILSVLRYLTRLAQVRQADTVQMEQLLSQHISIKSHRLLCDNRGVITRINNLRNLTSIFPNTTMESEWDILAEIRTTLQMLAPASQPTFEHIKGHQDKSTPLEDLPVTAQMNCEADQWANEYLLRYPDVDHSRVPILPTTGCQLQLPHGTVTHDYKRALNLARTVPPMQARLCKKHNWNQEDLESIDWAAHGRALQSLTKHKTTLVKYLNDIIPVGKLANKYDPKYPASCPSCSEPLETREHFWSCPAQSRHQWRKQCQGNLLKLLSSLDTAPPLQQLYLDAMDALIHGKPLESIPIDPAVARVASAQARVGWHHILKGRFVHEWSAIQTQYLGSKVTHRNNGDTWLARLIKGWFEEWLSLWKSRNEDLHGRDALTRQQAADRQTLRDLQLFYDKHDGYVTPRLQWLFNKTLQERLEDGNIGNARIWLYTWQAVVERSYTTALETG